MKIEGVIWDVDGVILDSEQVHAETESEVAGRFGIKITPSDVIKLYSGVHINQELEDMARRANKPLPLKQALEIRREILARHIEQGVPLIPGVDEVLHSLSGQYKQGLVTQSEKSFVEAALEHAGILNLFGARIYGEDIEKPKPNPRPFLQAARILNVSPEMTAVIEDSESGFKAAKAAGMLLIARKAYHNQDKDFSLADYIIEDLREIPKILLTPNPSMVQ